MNDPEAALLRKIVQDLSPELQFKLTHELLNSEVKMDHVENEREYLTLAKQALAEGDQNWPHLTQDLRDDIASREARLNFYAQQRGALLALVTDRGEAERLWRRYCEIYSEPARKLRVFRTVLIGAGLVDKTAALGVAVDFVDEEARRRDLEALAEEQELRQALGQILNACSDKELARQLYNRLPEPLSEAKLDRLVRAGVEKKILSAAWLPSRRVGGLVAWLRKMISPATANKSLDPRTANK